MVNSNDIAIQVQTVDPDDVETMYRRALSAVSEG